MYLISWNVAGWSSTSHAIRESFGSLHDFFACTEADIICLQECKGTLAKLQASPVDMGASDLPRSRRPSVPPLSRLSRCHSATGTVAPKTSQTKSGSGVGGGVNDGIEGWESFWSFSGKQHRGFNGVVTFARKGLTWRCDNQPFAEDAYNDEGRVVVTHHSAFVVVNVYVPNARGGTRHEFKFGFLHALEELMERLRREAKKPVMLVGDLNMTYRAYDGAWSLRRIHLGTLLQLETLAAEKSDTEWAMKLPHLPKAALRRVVNTITHHLCARVVELVTSSNPTGTSYDAGASSSAFDSPLASTLSPVSPGTGVVSVDAEICVDGDTLDREALQRVYKELQHNAAMDSAKRSRPGYMYEAPPVPLRALYGAGFRNTYTSEFVKSFACAHNNELYAVVRYCGLSPHSDASAAFMSRLLHLRLPAAAAGPVLAGRLPWETNARDDADLRCGGFSKTRMFDSFLLTAEVVRAHAMEAAAASSGPDASTLDRLLLIEVEQPQLQPYCPCAYTCWDQSRNRRLENEGTRLDYIMVDATLLPAVVCRAETVNNVFIASGSTATAPCSPAAATALQESRAEFFSEVSGVRYRDGVQRAMANGAYPPAPYDGSGMPALAGSARELCCAGLPATGLFVTPPQFSDHSGVGLVLDLSRLGGPPDLQPRPGKLVEEHKCMYRPPVGLHTFFAAAATAANTKKPTSPSETLSEAMVALTPSHTPVPVTRTPAAANGASLSVKDETTGDKVGLFTSARKRAAVEHGSDSVAVDVVEPEKTAEAVAPPSKLPRLEPQIQPVSADKKPTPCDVEVVDVDEL